MVRYFLFAQIAGCIRDDQMFQFTKLCIGRIPPTGIVKSFSSAIVSFDGKSYNRYTVDFHSDIRGPVIVIAGCFGTDFKRNGHLIYIICF